VFWYLLQILYEIFLIMRIIQRDSINIHTSSCKVPLSLLDFIEYWIFRQIFEKISNIKFYQNPSSGSWVVPCGHTEGRMDRHDEANDRFSEFSKRAWTPKVNFLQQQTDIHNKTTRQLVMLLVFQQVFSWSDARLQVYENRHLCFGRYFRVPFCRLHEAKKFLISWRKYLVK
jgi:hypothetical protein